MPLPAGAAAAAISGGAGLLGDIFGFASAKSLSNTAHQREVADMKKAGLNPILSVMGGQGASTPNVGNFGGAMEGVQSARRLEQEMKVMKQQAFASNAQGLKAGVEAETLLQQQPYLVDSAKSQAAGARADLIGRQNEGKARSTWVGKNVVPWAEMMSRSLFGPLLGGVLGRFSVPKGSGNSGRRVMELDRQTRNPRR